jgi:hypothetical protein
VSWASKRQADDPALSRRRRKKTGLREILVSSLVKELTHSAGDIRFEEARAAELKGLTGTYTLHAVTWE